MTTLSGHPNLFFTADWHFNHDYVARKRGFASTEGMNEALIAGHNGVVRPSDLVYVLGDLFVKGTVEQAMAIRKRLNGNIYAVEGNHDSIARRMAKQGAFVWLRNYAELRLGPPWFEGEGERKQLIVLSHYAFRTWRNAGHGSWMLYGHSHTNLTDIPHYLSFDVGVDGNGMAPYSLEDVIQRMALKRPAFDAWKASLGPEDPLEFSFEEGEE
jgi:calcineurin-like phosphoesterase family protein